MSDLPPSASADGDLVFVGDVHLDRCDADLEAFLAFLTSLEATTRRLVLLGDLFNLWIGRRDLELEHQRAVVERLTALRRAGMTVRYVEGNRDYRIARLHEGTALDEATLAGVSEEFGGRRIRAIHGDLANPSDRRYRRWRWFSRTPLFWAAFQLLPSRRRMRLAESLERRLRSTNTEYKRSFPEREVREYGARFLAEGFDTVVLGHFHVEKELEVGPDGPRGRILVLPEWRESRRHLRVTPGGEVSFVDSA